MPQQAGARPKRRISPLQFCAILYFTPLLILILFHYPYATDPQTEKVHIPGQATGFYKQVYAETVGFTKEEAAKDDAYAAGTNAWNAANHPEVFLKDFVTEYHLENKRILEVGSGQGHLQD